MIPGRRWLRRSACSVAFAVVAGATITATPAAGAASIVRIEQLTDRWQRVFVDSPMGEQEVQVLLPRDRSRPRPTLYLLDGRSADDTGSHWTERTDVVDFFADKNVNVVLTVGGTASYYTDWQRRDPRLGSYEWETFLTEQLPPLLNAAFEGSGTDAVAGISMGGAAAAMLAARHPGRYAAVASFSGCYDISSDLGQAQARLIVASYGGDPDNMFGQPDDPDWAAHDVLAHADGLRGTAVYLSAGSGLPGPHENPANPELATAVAFGGPIEAVANSCTRQLAGRLDALGIPATVDLRPVGTHSWAYWTTSCTAPGRSSPVRSG